LSVLRWAVRWSLHRPHLLAWACVWTFVLGGLFASDIPIDLLPSLAPIEVTIETEAPGLVAQQVEETVTDPIESALLGTAGVSSVSSRSAQGLSVIIVRFAPEADPTSARQLVTENLARVSALPPGVSAPRVSPPVAPGPDLLTIGFTSDKLSPMDLRDLVMWTVRPRLLSTKGVSSVAVYGGQIRRIEVQARPGDLTDSDLGFLDIVQATRRATSVAGAGFIDTPNQRVLIEPHGQADTLDAVKDGQIQTPGADPVRIDDVADVAEAPAPAFGDALIDGKPGMLLVVDRAPGANTVETTRALDASLAQLTPSLSAQGVSVRADLDRPASFISGATGGILRDLLIGLALVALGLALFMRDLRVVLVTLAAVPLTLIAAVVVLKATGLTLNAMTLGGLAVALGLVIDDAVIDVESIVSDLRDAERQQGSRLEAILAASLEVRAPVLYATLAMTLSLVPLLFLPGPERVLLAPLATVIIVAALVSLLIAIVVTPALALIFLRHIGPAREPAVFQRLRAAQARWLSGVGARRWPALLLAGAVVALALTPLLFFRTELLPSVHDSQFLIEADAPASSSIDAVRATGIALTHDLAALPGVRAVTQRIGRDATSSEGAGIEHSVYDVAVTPTLSGAQQTALARRIETMLAGYPGTSALVRSRFDAGQAQGAGSTSVQIKVFGQDLDAIDLGATRVRAALGAMPQRPTLAPARDVEAPVVRVDLNFNKLALDGLSAADVLDTIQAAFAGETVAHIYEGPRVIDLAVSAQSGLRRDPEGVGDLLVRSTSGFAVPLRSIANVYLTDDRDVISHEGGLRSDLVEAVAPAGDVDSFAAAARAAVQNHAALPPSVFVGYQVVNSAAEATRNLAWAYGLGIFAVFAFLTIAFDGRTAAVILAATLFAFVGGVAAVALAGGLLSIGEMAGLAALVGLSMRSAILLISRAEEAVAGGGKSWTLATVAGAAGERLVPLLASTALVVLALAPFAVDAGAAGREIIGPMSIVIIAGVITGAIGDLLVLPVMLFVFWRPRAPFRPPAQPS
jgi:Cu/Ag efflux pump CusA